MSRYTTRLLHAADDNDVSALLVRVPESLLYASPIWRRVVSALCPDAVPHSVGVFDGELLVAMLPGFVRSGAYGAIYNSLPFFGSNGGLVVDASVALEEVAAAAITTLRSSLSAAYDVAAQTVIASPFAPHAALYRAFWQPTAIDQRIGQLTALPVHAADPATELLAIVHPKTRSAIRAAQRSCLHFARDHTDEAWHALHALHEDGMTAVGGTVKPWRVFEVLRDLFEADDRCALYTARDGTQIVSALLVLHHGRVAEYFTPATNASYRVLQPMSALIMIAMDDAMTRGAHWWNWGGTWKSQAGVYRFKSRWGAQDFPYEYFVQERADRTLREIAPEVLRREYPWFYVVPFADAGAATSTRLPNEAPV